MEGVVKWFDERKGYGFITIEGQEDLFVHHSDIQMDGFRKLSEAQVVEFEKAEGNFGKPKAINVFLIQ